MPPLKPRFDDNSDIGGTLTDFKKPKDAVRDTKQQMNEIRRLLSPPLHASDEKVAELFELLMGHAFVLEKDLARQEKRASFFFGWFFDKDSIKTTRRQVENLKRNAHSYSRMIHEPQKASPISDVLRPTLVIDPGEAPKTQLSSLGGTIDATISKLSTLNLPAANTSGTLSDSGDRSTSLNLPSDEYEFHSYPIELFNLKGTTIGIGSTATVKQIQWPFSPGGLVVVKEFRFESEQCKKDIRRRACREATLWSRFKHPNVAPFVGAIMINEPGDSPSAPLLISKYAEHGNVEVYMKNMREEPDTHIPSLVKDFISGLSYLHRVPKHDEDKPQIYHGDIHMQNLLVGRQPGSETPILWISDFGLSGEVSATSKLQASHITHRTFFRAPELDEHIAQINQGVERNQNGTGGGSVIQMDRPNPWMPLMQKADIFSFGVVVFFMMSHKFPFKHRRDQHGDKLVQAKAEDDPQIILNCIEFEHERRCTIEDVDTRYSQLLEIEYKIQNSSTIVS